MCLPQALVVGVAHANKEPNLKKLRQSTKQQTNLALQMLKEADLTIPQEGAGIPELKILQNYLHEYKIVVYQYATKGKDVIFEGDNDVPKKINLIYHKGHYNLITSLTATFACNYYCDTCHVPYKTKDTHRCSKSCPCCQTTPPCENKTNIVCTECNRGFRNDKCFENHENSLCKNVKKCFECLKTYRISNKAHVCEEHFCITCKNYVSKEHYCYIQPNTASPKLEKILYVFYDLETQQDKNMYEIREHIPNLCVFEQRCSECIDQINISICIKCGERRKVLRKDDDIIKTFLDYLLNPKNKKEFLSK